MKRLWVATLCAITVANSAQAKSAEEKIAELIAQPPSSLVPQIKVEGDQLSPRIEVNTLGVVSLDRIDSAFLRGYVDKKTGQVTAQIYHHAIYRGSGWNFFTRGTYLAEGNLTEVDALRAGSDVDCYRYGCTYYEHIILPVPFETLEGLASRFSRDNGIQYRLIGKSGVNLDGGIPANEIAAFVEVMNRYNPNAKKPSVALPAPAIEGADAEKNAKITNSAIVCTTCPKN